MKELDWEWVEVTTSSVVNLGHSWQGPFFFSEITRPFSKKTSFCCFGANNGPNPVAHIIEIGQKRNQSWDRKVDMFRLRHFGYTIQKMILQYSINYVRN